MHRRQFCQGLTLATLGAASMGAARAQDYPARAIKWIVPYLAGTAPDSTVRIVADALSAELRQPVVVDNKGGAAGNLGAQIAARAAPDGYTWVYSATTMATSMRMYKKPGYDVMKDFTHVGRITLSDLAVTVHPEAGFASLKDLLDKARKLPGKLSYGTGGVGTPAHMAAALILNAAGVEALHVPYKGASESANAVLGKQVDFALTITSVSLPHVLNGKAQALAVTGSRRNPRLPTVPTLEEAGLPGVAVASFGGLSVPAATPAPIVKRLEEALAKVLAQPELRTRLEANGGVVWPSSPQEYTDNLRAEIALTERMMKLAKLDAQ